MAIWNTIQVSTPAIRKLNRKLDVNAIGVDGDFPHTRLLDTSYSLRSPKAALRSKRICLYGYVYETTDLGV